MAETGLSLAQASPVDGQWPFEASFCVFTLPSFLGRFCSWSHIRLHDTFTSALIPGARSSPTLKVPQDSQTFYTSIWNILCYYAGQGCVSLCLRALFVLFGQQSGFVVTWAVLTQRIFEREFPNSFCSCLFSMQAGCEYQFLGGIYCSCRSEARRKDIGVLGARGNC